MRAENCLIASVFILPVLELLAEYKYCDAGAWEPHPKEPHALMQNLPVIAADGSYMKGVRCEVIL